MLGNRKGAKSSPDALATLVAKDVKCGYAMALPQSKAHLIPSILLAPMHIMHQNTIIKLNKELLTHNQSNKFGSGTSVSSL